MGLVLNTQHKMATKFGSQLQRLNVALRAVRTYSAAAGGHSEHAKSANTWKKAFFFAGIPAVTAIWYNCFCVLDMHPERAEFVAYPHLRIRNRAFPWRDGQKSLFHNSYTMLCQKAMRRAVRNSTTDTKL